MDGARNCLADAARLSDHVPSWRCAKYMCGFSISSSNTVNVRRPSDALDGGQDRLWLQSYLSMAKIYRLDGRSRRHGRHDRRLSDRATSSRHRHLQGPRGVRSFPVYRRLSRTIQASVRLSSVRVCLFSADEDFRSEWVTCRMLQDCSSSVRTIEAFWPRRRDTPSCGAAGHRFVRSRSSSPPPLPVPLTPLIGRCVETAEHSSPAPAPRDPAPHADRGLIKSGRTR